MEDVPVQEFEEIDEAIRYNDAAVDAFAKWRKNASVRAANRRDSSKKKTIFSRIFSCFKKKNSEKERERSLMVKDMELCVIYALSWDSTSLLSTIPYMPLRLAYVCAFLNIFLPGCGTLVGALSIYTCSNPQGITKRDSDELYDPFVSNMCVGISQMFTVTFLLVGWIWSIVWGINMILLAKHHIHLVDTEIHRLRTLALANKLFR